MITITHEEIKAVGLFSSKESVVINKDKTLVMTLSKRNKMVIRLRGNSGTPAFSWAKPIDYKSQEIDLFREKAVGNARTIKKVLSYFEVPTEDINSLTNQHEFRKNYDSFIVSKSKEDNQITVSIKITNTI